MAGLTFTPPLLVPSGGEHHGAAAAQNIAATSEAMDVLRATLEGASDTERILLRAAAGAGKSYALKRMVDEALAHPTCSRVGVTAFTNKQLHPLAEDLGRELGKDTVCLLVSKDKLADVAESVKEVATVVVGLANVPADASVLIATSHMFGFTGWRLHNQLGSAANGERIFDVLFIDEAWQLALHRYRTIERLAPVDVGVGDVGQLPPLDPGQNPWRGDPGYNPYRAWPTEFTGDERTWSIDLPAVWRPTEAQLELWRAFYQDWDSLDCVAGPGDRTISTGALAGPAADVWAQVGTGSPTLVEVDGLPDPDAADIDPPLMALVEEWLDQLLAAGFAAHGRHHDASGVPDGDTEVRSDDPQGQTLIAVLATRNQAVDDATAMVDRLNEIHDLPENMLVASTVDSWQGQTNAITIAVHPLSGASALDEFNSAFGRLAVACTRATHGLLVVSRAGLDELLATAPPRPGTPLGEPGPRQLPRQTHQRILTTFARGRLALGNR